MQRRNFLTGVATTGIVAGLISTNTNAATKAVKGKNISMSNPLLAKWNTPFGVPDFTKFKNENYKPAILEALKRHKAELNAVANNKEDATFANVIEAMEKSGMDLSKILSVFFHLTNADTNPELQKIEGEISAKLSEHNSSINQDPNLFAKVQSIYLRRKSLNLDYAQLRLVERTYQGFVKGGALLNPEQKKKIAEIDAKLSEIQVKFDQNVLAGQSSFYVPLKTEADFAGLSESQIDAAKNAAKDRKIKDAIGAITLSRSSFEPFLTNSTRRDLREKVQKGWMAVGTTGENDNRPLISQIVDLRNERANILGFKTFADFQLSDKMAKSPENAMKLMNKIWDAAIATAKRDLASLQALANKEGMTEPLKSWDWWHYAEKVRKDRYSVDEGEVKQYFELNNMIDAMMYHSGKLFGLSYKKLDNLPVWHPDVVAYEVFDENNKSLAIWYGDFYARSSKQSGAWMSSFRDQQKLIGDIKPIVFNVCNYNKPSKGKPCLLSFDDVTTLFHEFGHALHGMLSNVVYPSQSGTSVLRDFVEFPSQLMEHWVSTPEILSKFAKHHETGAIIPQSLVDKLTAASKFNEAWATVEYLSAAIMDIKMHTITGKAPKDIDAWESEILNEIGLIPEIVVRYRPGYFKHTFSGGYAAGYYSYIWASVLETDAFNAFKETGNVYDTAMSKKLKENIFAAGDTKDPMELYIDFRGREPSVEGLLEHRGLSI